MTERLHLPPLSKRYRPALDVKWAKLLPEKPPFITRKRSRGRFAVGVRYEREAMDYLALLALPKPHLEFIEAPWVEYFDREGRRWCQFDGVLLDRKQQVAVLVEVKYQHTIDAWWQLTHLYRPIAHKLWPSYTLACLEIVHWYDPQVAFPEPYDLTDNPFRIPHVNKVAVFIWNPKRRRSARSSSDGLAADGHNVSEGAGQAIGAIRLQEGAK